MEEPFKNKLVEVWLPDISGSWRPSFQIPTSTCTSPYFLYSYHLNTGLVWYSNGRFVSGCQMVRYSNGGLKTGLKKASLWSKMFGIQMVRQVP